MVDDLQAAAVGAKNPASAPPKRNGPEAAAKTDPLKIVSSSAVNCGF
jgi:hypothetical protein